MRCACRGCAARARSCLASSPRTNSRSAVRVSISPGRPHAILGTPITTQAARLLARVRVWRPMALGSDTGGSVRNPASACGIVGLKPTYGLVSRRGVFPLSFTLDHVGPMTHTVADNALMLNIIAGHDPLDPGSAAAPAGHYVAGLERGVRGLRIGFVRHFHEEDTPADPEVATGLEQVAGTLRSLGAEIRDVRLPTLGEFGAVNRVILQSEAWAIHGPWLRVGPATMANSPDGA